MRCAFYDITWEVGLPVVTADLVAPDLPSIWRGAGCHPDPAVALSRALTEAAQSRLTYISGARDDLTQFADGANAMMLHERFRVPDPRRAFDELPQMASGDLNEDLARILAALDRMHLEPFVVDITRVEMGVPVVICFVPGLREGHYG